MNLFSILLVAALIFGICFLVDKGFSKLFRSKAQHLSGKAVRANKRYGVFGVILIVLGIMAICVGVTDGMVLTIGGIIVLLMGTGLAVHYLSFGIFYDAESFLVSSFGKPSHAHRYSEIREQQLYLVQGGNVIVELYLEDGRSVSLQSAMDGVYTFLDTAFSGWCRQKGLDRESCSFHDPSNHWWFPHEQEES